MEDIEVNSWKNANRHDLWVFDKLILADRLGYVCGPIGLDVPKPDEYVVRPCVNVLGMGRGASIEFIEKDTTHLPYGYFWCEKFTGRHISVDYFYGKQCLTVEGFREDPNLLYRFSKWKKVDDIIPLPSIISHLETEYKYINVEYIDGKAIEIHFRHNADFDYENVEAIPVWNDQDIIDMPGYRFVENADFYRKGFYIR